MLTEEKIKNIIIDAVKASEERIVNSVDTKFLKIENAMETKLKGFEKSINKSFTTRMDKFSLVVDGYVTGLKQYIDENDDRIRDDIRDLTVIVENIQESIKVGNEGFNTLYEKINNNHKELVILIDKQAIRVTTLERVIN